MSLIKEQKQPEATNLFNQPGFTSSSENASFNAVPNISPTLESANSVQYTNGSNLNRPNNDSVPLVNEHNSSPLNLSSVLHNLSISGIDINDDDDMVSNEEEKLISHGPYLLKISHIPEDITLRECHSIFALATGILNVELSKTSGSDNTSVIIAKFDNLVIVSQYASILSTKCDIFGPGSDSACIIEVIDEITNKPIDYRGIVPKQHNYLLSSDVRLLPVFGSSPDSNSNKPASNRKNSMIFPKSRFSFSDPFTNDPYFAPSQQESIGQNNSSNTTINNNSSNDINNTNTNSSMPATSKTLFTMESDNNEDIWNPITTQPVSATLNEFPQSSTPVFEWGPLDVRKNSILFNSVMNHNSTTSDIMPQSANGNIGHSTVSESASSVGPLASQSSYSAMQQYLPPTSLNNYMRASDSASVTSSKDSSNILMAGSNYPQQMQYPPQISNANTIASQSSSIQLGQQSLKPDASYRSLISTPFSQQYNTPAAMGINSSLGNNGVLNNISNVNVENPNSEKKRPNVSNAANVKNESAISQADLSLLAKIPPPANPADQNPPCNTLYVGNLPPDATEQELRQLFSSQEGFRRLSFKNKSIPGHGHGHGPMCFVEFDDVSFSTRALAKLYGSQLPRSTINSKGGIRLSFSKNPLGVRGPQARRSANNSNSSVGISTANSNTYMSSYNKL
ncbi:hypothetical protein KAFR_0F00290 [Kazachstania africana CBS 2517]|uniref:RRM domain-containing protein n=1 Tax=Kazachstania africana (strain ATCC 22294 / BCRC 22015 / CBS 2517 / CECT 1963 / NBRC 1671 / NRRL Y-8276) TaxID=1071382 RepID=H2AW76_KAZAF|nr:hypothetical protein KAFR_0F00290 [Kazachstania africana CBS 2517]CCF58626.1 hypothetical protein KAFR_0F00290 [Kazachstania africana CBS 2517]